MLVGVVRVVVGVSQCRSVFVSVSVFNAKDNKSALEELADLLELIHAASELHGTTMSEIDKIRINKAKKNGAFNEKIFLIEVKDQ